MVEENFEVRVNFQENKLTIVREKVMKLFRNGKKILEFDNQGYSAIVKEDGKLKKINVLNSKRISEKEVNQKEARRIIKEAEKFRRRK